LRAGDALRSPGAVRDFLRLTLIGRDHEVFVVVLLDAQNRVLACEELFRGTLTQTNVYPREVVKCALARNAAAVILAHNHPSGIAEPSHADEVLTQSLKQALALVDIRVLDHFIVAGNAALSFAERGLI
jgi:DNA repair protein RadC